jgi:hypothetical protein
MSTHSMVLPQFFIRTAGVGIVALGLLLAWEVRQNISFRDEVRQQSSANAKTVAELKQQIAIKTTYVAATEDQVKRLREAVKELATIRPAVIRVRTEDAAKEAIDRAAQLINDGKHEEALEVYLKCYRELQVAQPGSVECQHLVSAMLALSRTYPPARTAVGLLRDAAVAELQANPKREELAFEIAVLNERLGDGERTVAVYDLLPPGSIQRQALAKFAFKSLVDAGRYSDALVGRSCSQMLAQIDSATSMMSRIPSALQKRARTQFVETTAMDIEVLTGAGRVDDARVLTEKLLAFDNSDATRALLAQHLAHANSSRK